MNRVAAIDYHRRKVYVLRGSIVAMFFYRTHLRVEGLMKPVRLPIESSVRCIRPAFRRLCVIAKNYCHVDR